MCINEVGIGIGWFGISLLFIFCIYSFTSLSFDRIHSIVIIQSIINKYLGIGLTDIYYSNCLIIVEKKSTLDYIINTSNFLYLKNKIIKKQLFRIWRKSDMKRKLTKNSFMFLICNNSHLFFSGMATHQSISTKMNGRSQLLLLHWKKNFFLTTEKIFL